MLCSSCSETVQPVVAIDIDGTLGNYHEHLLRFAGSYLGLPLFPAGHDLYDGSEPFRDWFCRVFQVEVATFRDIKLAYRQGAQKRSMPVDGNASRFLWTLREDGAEVWLTTTRPYLRLDNIDPDTREWLRRHNLPYDGLLYGDDKYHKLAALVDPRRVVAVLDDQADLYDQAAAAFGPDTPILCKSRWNRGVTRPNQVAALDLAYGLISDRVCDWKERNGLYTR